jgi:uncharacterized protein (TIGR02271 family)
MANRNRTNQTTSDTVVGVFLDQNHANQAIQYLEQQGFNAQIADESAIKAFRSTGLEDEVVNLYENRFSEGNSIVVVRGNKPEEAMRLMLQMGAEFINISEKSGTSRYNWMQGKAQNANYYQNLDRSKRQYGMYDETRGRAMNENEVRVQLREEKLTPVKQAVQTGEVGVQKTVREQQQEVPVNLRREEVVIDRQAVDRPADPNEIGRRGDETMRVPVYEEQAELQKQARVYEEVTLSKQPVEEQRTISGTARREELDINQSGDVNIQGNPAVRTGENWTQVMPRFRERYEQTNRGGNWREVEPAYRYAYEMSNDPRYQGRSYTDIEKDLRNDWKNRGEPTAWDKISANVRQAWNDVTS